MFFSGLLKEEITRLSTENELLASELEDIKEELARIRRETQSSEFVFDFSAVDVFSVERIWYDDAPATIIGFNKINEEGKPETVEWKYFCNEKRHQEVVNSFKKHIESKGKKK